MKKQIKDWYNNSVRGLLVAYPVSLVYPPRVLKITTPVEAVRLDEDSQGRFSAHLRWKEGDWGFYVSAYAPGYINNPELEIVVERWSLYDPEVGSTYTGRIIPADDPDLVRDGQGGLRWCPSTR